MNRLLASAFVLVSTGGVWADGPNDDNRTKMRGTPPGRISNLGGVRSQPGVRSQSPRSFATPIDSGVSRPTLSRPTLSKPTLQPGPGMGGGSPTPLNPPHNSHSGGHHGHRQDNPGRRVESEPDHGRRFGHYVGDGFNFSGSLKDGPWTLVFSTGGLGRHWPKDGCFFPVYTGGCAAVLPCAGLVGCYANSNYFNWGYGGLVGPAWLEQSGSVYAANPTNAMPPAADEPSRPLTALEHAEQMLKAGESKAAVAAYQAYLKTQPLDSAATRALGLSLIENGQVGDGVSVIGMAYRSDSTLAATPVDDEVFGSSSRLRTNVGRVSRYANREKSASAWLALAVLMQAEGRVDRARAMIARAKDAGLEVNVVDEMNAAFSPRAGAQP